MLRARWRSALQSAIDGHHQGKAGSEVMDPKSLQGMLEAAQKQAEQMQDQMKKTLVEASAGGGSVTVKMDGSKRVIAVKIDPEVVKAGDVEMLEDLVTAAVNEAGRKADEAMQGSMGQMVGGLDLPGMFS